MGGSAQYEVAAQLARARLQNTQAERQIQSLELQVATQVREYGHHLDTDQATRYLRFVSHYSAAEKTALHNQVPVAFAVTYLVGVIGAVLTSKGIKTLKEQSLVPEKTVQTLKEDKQWLQGKVNS